MSYFKKLTFLKVLTAVAWADGEMTHSELNHLKSFYRKFGLDRDDFAELKPYLDAPVSKKEKDELFDCLISELSSPKEKKEILRAMGEMLNSKRKPTEAEKRMVEEFSNLLAQTSFTKRSLGKFRNLLKGALFQHSREKNPELEKYFKRRVFKKIELKLSENGEKIELPDDKIYFVCLIGTLLASVAHVDEHIDDSEKKELKRFLKEQFSFKERELKILFEVIEEQARQGFDFHEVVTEVNRLTSYKDRLKLVDVFFAMAGADGDLAHDEIEEIRRITKAMRISHKLFIDSKMKVLARLR